MKSSCNPNECHLWSGLILFVVGAIFLLQKLDVVPETTWTYLWPAMLIVVGLKLMMASGSSCCGSGMCETPSPAPKKAAPKKTAKPKKRRVAKKK